MQFRTLSNLGNLIISLSDALELAQSTLAMHQQRTAFTAWEMARCAGLNERRSERLFLAGLFHDIGALSGEEKLSLFVNETINLDTHCIRGERLFLSNPWLAGSASIVRNHHRDWDSSPPPRDTEEVQDAQILYLADALDRRIVHRKYILHQVDDLKAYFKTLSGHKISPSIVDVFLDLSQREEFWLDMKSPRLYSLLMQNGPLCNIEVDVPNVQSFAELVSRLIDYKSPFTSTHSAGVACCATIIARKIGMSEHEVQMMGIAALLHDLGKLAVPNALLEKPGRLTPEEFATIKQHTYYTFAVLGNIGGLREVAEWGAYHHERMDGKGYPFRRSAANLPMGARIMSVADVFAALTEDRPYRKGMETGQTVKLLQESATNGAFDPAVVETATSDAESIHNAIRARQQDERETYVSAVHI